jgi:SAM-dependent methyltransferase
MDPRYTDPVDPKSFLDLLSPSGQAALRAAEALQPVEQDFLRHFQHLGRSFPRELARSALITAILRREAETKFPAIADNMYFTREALEQASSGVVSAYRSRRFQGFSTLFDLGCSIGSDTLHLAAYGPVFGVDRDPLRLLMARANLESAGQQAGFLQADLAAPLPLRPGQPAAAFFDPARRTGGRRVFSVRQYSPPLDIVHTWQPIFSAVGVKISPGVRLEELAGLDAEVEFISWGGDLKEAVLWLGALKSADFRATVLPGGHTLTAAVVPAPQVGPPRAYLYEPDPAVLRAGLVTVLAEQLDAVQLDPTIAYLTADTCRETPFARAWAVLDWLPFHLKKLRTYLRARDVGRVVVKKRGSPLQPEKLVQDLRLSGEQERVLVLTKMGGRPVVLVCEPQPVSW